MIREWGKDLYKKFKATEGCDLSALRYRAGEQDDVGDFFFSEGEHEQAV